MRKLMLVVFVACGGASEVEPPLEVTPVEVHLLPGSHKRFWANRLVDWELTDETAGTITADGDYTAPPLRGRFHLVAVAADGSSAVAHIEVSW